MLAKNSAKIILLSEAALLCHLSNGFISAFQHFFCFFKPKLDQSLTNRLSVFSFKRIRQCGFAAVKMFAEVMQCDFLHIMLLQIPA